MRAITRFVFSCVGAGLFVGRLALCLTGVGAIFGIPLMAVGMGMVETNKPRRPSIDGGHLQTGESHGKSRANNRGPRRPLGPAGGVR
jgi:hypothetical protein